MAEESKEWNQALPFSEKKQNAALGHLMTNERFFLQARNIIKPEWFVQPSNQRVWKNMIEFYAKYKTVPSKEEILDFGDLRGEDQKTKDNTLIRMKLFEHETQFFNLDHIRDELTVWLHTRIFHETVNSSINLFNKEHFAKAYQKLEEATKTIRTITFENDLEEKFIDFQEEFAKSEAEIGSAITFGLPALDKLLVPHSPGKEIHGGLFKGDTTVILAPTNVGKTTCLVTVARHNVLRGKDVLFITHEGRPADIKEKIWCSVLDCSKGALFRGYKTPEGTEHIRNALALIDKHLTYIPMNKPGLTVEEVEAVMRRKNDERIAKTGKGYDLLLNDYPAKLTTILGREGRLEKRHMDNIVYDYFVQLSLDLKWHSVLAIQTNREGAKASKGKIKGSAQRLVGMEDVAESYAVMQTATNVITLNRDGNKIIFLIDKSRSSETGIAVVCQANYAHCLTHDPRYPHTWYKSNASMGERLEALLETYNGKEIPEHEIYAKNDAD